MLRVARALLCCLAAVVSSPVYSAPGNSDPGSTEPGNSNPGDSDAVAPTPLQHDPFVRPVVPAAQTLPASVEPAVETLELRAVLQGNTTSALANVSGKIVGVGEEIQGYIVSAIENGRVVLRRGERETILEWNDESSG